MSGKSEQTQQATSTSAPWAPAQPVLQNLLGGLNSFNTGLTPNQSGALDQMVALAKAGNPYAPAIDSFATTALAGGPDRTGLLSDAYANYQKNLQGTAAGDYLDPNRNPWFAQTTQTLGNDIQNRVNAMFAGSGRDLSGANQQLLSRSLAEGLAPVYGSIYGTERQNQLNAQNALYGAGNTTAQLLSGLDQTKLNNQTMGVNAANAATQAQLDPYNRLITAESMKQGIPLTLLQQIAGIATPIAGLGGQTSSSMIGTSTMSPAQQAWGWMNAIANLNKIFPGGGGR